MLTEGKDVGMMRKMHQKSFGWFTGPTEPCIRIKDVGDEEEDVCWLEKDVGMQGEGVGSLGEDISMEVEDVRTRKKMSGGLEEVHQGLHAQKHRLLRWD